MRVLVEQTRDNAHHWLSKLELTDKIGLHILMGGDADADWDLKPEKPAILIGTQDMLLSRALNRGYGMSHYRWPMAFGLLNNDCLWVFDEVQLMGSGLATSTQLDAFREIFGTFGVGRSIWMSATLKEDWLYTVDFEHLARSIERLELSEADKRHANLGQRIEAPKRLYECTIPVSRPDKIADAILSAHKLESRTLVVVNTVKRAVALYKELTELLAKQSGTPIPELVLIHSRFRPDDRKRHINRLLADPPPAGLIAVTTQVVEAGVDVDARTLFTELAPWSSLVQRFGRCNRRGDFADAAVYWMDLFRAEERNAQGKERSKTDRDKEIESNVPPYVLEELSAAAVQLREMDNVSIACLEARIARLSPKILALLFPYEPRHVIRRKDLIELFDTTPDLAGNDIDVSRFIRDSEDFDVQVFWRNVAGKVPEENEPGPRRDELCSVPVKDFRKFLQKKTVFRKDFLQGKWIPTQEFQIYPGQTYLIPVSEGGYDPEVGWDPSAGADKTRPVESETVLRPSDWNDADQHSDGLPWQRISEHSDMVVRDLGRLLRALGIDLGKEHVESLNHAARWHDRGKAHEVFRSAIVMDDDHTADDWAKAPTIGRYGRKGFRHELASALAMLQEGLSDLACYLAAAHHGKVRLSIRSLPHERRPSESGVRFARGIWDGETLVEVDLGGGVTAPEIKLSLEPMELGLSPEGEPSWAERMLGLRDDQHLRPFRLAFLEAILRAADMRASR